MSWSEWGPCRSDTTGRDTTCDGGTRARSRDCERAEDASWFGCGAGGWEEERCAEEACKPEMPYWNDQMGQTGGWSPVHYRYLPRGDTMLERCVSYCNDDRLNARETPQHAKEHCTAVSVITRGRV